MPADNPPIVVPLDGSKNAENAIPFAVFLANAYQAPLHLLHVVDEDELRGQPDMEQANETFAAYANDLIKDQGIVSGHRATALHGNPARVIIDYASDATAIVIATHGRSGIKATFIGSVADKVIRGTPVPTLVVRGVGEPAVPGKGPVVVGVDGSEVAEQGLEAARGFAEKLGVDVVIVRAYTIPVPVGAEFAFYPPDIATAYEEGAKEYLAHVARPEEKTILMSGSAAPAIEKAAEDEDAGVVVVTSQGKGFAARIALGSTTDRLVHSIERPLLVIPVVEAG